MKLKQAIISAMVLSVPFSAFPDEGIRTADPLSRAIVRKMQETGLKPEADKIYDEGNVSIKDASVSPDSGCTGSMISDNGLLVNFLAEIKQTAK